MTCSNSLPKLGHTIDRFNQACAFLKKAMVSWGNKNLHDYETSMRKSATEAGGALEWALKTYLRGPRATFMSAEDRSLLKQPVFNTLIDLIERYADPPLSDHTVACFAICRDLLRNPAEHDAAIPSAADVRGSLSEIRGFIGTYLNVSTDQLAAIPDLAPSPSPKTPTRTRFTACLVETPLDFRSTIGSHQSAVHILVKPSREVEPTLRHAIDAIFHGDLQYIGASEPELVSLFLESIEEPLGTLRDLGLTLFALEITSTAHFRGATEPLQITDWTTTHYLIAANDSYFRAGKGPDKHKVHKFDPSCHLAVNDLGDTLLRSQGFYTWLSVKGVEEHFRGVVPWCMECCTVEMFLPPSPERGP